jgi:hypothetical protein
VNYILRRVDDVQCVIHFVLFTVCGMMFSRIANSGKQKIRNSVLLASDLSFIILKSLSNDNHEASQKAVILLGRFDML